MLGLHWQDIDLVEGSLRVRRPLQRVAGMGLMELEPKSSTSRRLVRLTPVRTAALKRQRVRVKEMRKLIGETGDERDLVFPSTIGGPLEPRAVKKRFTDFLEKAGLPRIRLHDLRHSSTPTTCPISTTRPCDNWANF